MCQCVPLQFSWFSGTVYSPMNKMIEQGFWNGPWWKHRKEGQQQRGSLFSSHLILSMGAGQWLHLVFLSGQVLLWNANIDPTSIRHKMWPSLPKYATQTWQQCCLTSFSHPVMLKHHVHDLDLTQNYVLVYLFAASNWDMTGSCIYLDACINKL